ncbi:hypothetical protein SCHPADRAFT_46100 [Schizopora paradoxa]|uniref:Uncharacterized protein n=1 Tax=Schizopora paradoxa TaxID=27342 RepID=A0A0H2SS38_9AGAM|nr:hypothetical protein SCHPADRAFT_46100 [Schizopora paradoxa]
MPADSWTVELNNCEAPLNPHHRLDRLETDLDTYLQIFKARGKQLLCPGRKVGQAPATTLCGVVSVRSIKQSIAPERGRTNRRRETKQVGSLCKCWSWKRRKSPMRSARRTVVIVVASRSSLWPETLANLRVVGTPSRTGNDCNSHCSYWDFCTLIVALLSSHLAKL